MAYRKVVVTLAGTGALALGLAGSVPALAGSSKKHWSTTQCNHAVVEWAKKHPKASSKEQGKYIESLKRDYGCKFGAL
jgi:hypothetical protein